MHATSQVGWLLCRYSMICKSGQFKIDSLYYMVGVVEHLLDHEVL